MSCDIEATIDQRPIDVEVQGTIVAMDLADGDYGDIAVSNNGATMTIENMGENATVTTGTYVSKVNQDLLIKVRKASAGTITKGQAVYIVGSTGNHLTVELARADAEVTSAYTIGIAATTITNTTDGFVIQNGRLTGLSTVSTTTFADGDAIYLSETTAGAYRVGLPQAPNHGVFLGFVIKANNGNAGEIDIRIDNYQELEELSDVYINNETTNDFLVRKATRWENTTPANVKTILAIDNVDNTSDANKPISTATQTALNAKVNKSGDTMTGALVNSTNGAVSTPPMSLTGSWYSGGTSTTTKPQLLIEPAGTTSTNWSTAGTGLGVNAPSGFTGNLLDLQVGSGSYARINVGTNNILLGAGAGSQLTNYSGIVAIGQSACGSVTTAGINMVAIGVQALRYLSVGNGSTDATAVGPQAGQRILAAGASVLLGGYAGQGSGNFSAQIQRTTCAGFEAGAGFNATTLADNSLFGYRAGFAINSGNQNTFIGSGAGSAVTTGSNNIAIGFNAAVDSITASNQINIGGVYYHDRIEGAKRFTGNVGFYNATPVAQPAAVADATDAASAITQLNLLLARMRTLGLIAT